MGSQVGQSQVNHNSDNGRPRMCQVMARKASAEQTRGRSLSSSEKSEAVDEAVEAVPLSPTSLAIQAAEREYEEAASRRAVADLMENRTRIKRMLSESHRHQRRNGARGRGASCPYLPVEGNELPTKIGCAKAVPPSVTYVTILSNYPKKDERRLQHLPYFSDNDHLRIDEHLYAENELSEESELDDEKYEYVASKVLEEFGTKASTLCSLSSSLGKSAETIQRRVKELQGDQQARKNKQRENLEITGFDTPNQLRITSAYERLFCRRCYTYKCSGHPQSQPRKRTFSTMKATQVENSTPNCIQVLNVQSKGNPVEKVEDSENLAEAESRPQATEKHEISESDHLIDVENPGVMGSKQSTMVRQKVVSCGAFCFLRKRNGGRESPIDSNNTHEPDDLHSRGTVDKSTKNLAYASQRKTIFGGLVTKHKIRETIEHRKLLKALNNARDEWTEQERTLLTYAFQIFGADACKIALCVGTRTCAQVWKELQRSGHTMRAFEVVQNQMIDSDDLATGKSLKKDSADGPKSKKRKKKNEKSRSIGAKIVRSMHHKGGFERALAKNFDACSHSGPCSAANNCKCVRNATFCEKYCSCGPNCRYKFPGCVCIGGCGTRMCPCFAASRECDPDTCRSCGAHKPRYHKPTPGERLCRNSNIGKGRAKHLLLGKSKVHGWGCFISESVKKSDFLCEYIGEVIGQEEADRRGKIYDKASCSYLFNLNEEKVVDAARKGNKIKFANHSSNRPNCYSRIVSVRGDNHIAIYAKQSMKPGDELFFDYQHDLCSTLPEWYYSNKGDELKMCKRG